MKKLMVAMFAVAMSFAAQAGQFKWQVTNLYIPNAQGGLERDIQAVASGTKFAADSLAVTLLWVGSDGETLNQITTLNNTVEGSMFASAQAAFAGTGSDTTVYNAIVNDYGTSSVKPDFVIQATYTADNGDVYTYS